MLRSRRISPNSAMNRFWLASPRRLLPEREVDCSSSATSLLVLAVVVVVGLEQHDAASVPVAEERERVVGGLLEVAEADDVAVGLDRVQDPVGAGERLDQAVGAAGSCRPTAC